MDFARLDGLRSARWTSLGFASLRATPLRGFACGGARVGRRCGGARVGRRCGGADELILVPTRADPSQRDRPRDLAG